MPLNLSFLKTRRGLVILGILIVTIIGVPLTVFITQQQQTLQQEAWHTTQSANSYCSNGVAVISVQFTNTEPSGAANAMNIVAKDLQTGLQISIGVVNPGESKSGIITTSSPSLQAGQVLFTLTWANGRSGTDSRNASYNAVATCVTVTPTTPPTSTPTTPPTSTPTTPPTETPTTIATSTPTTPPTETPTLPVDQTATPTTPPGSTETPTPVFSTETPGVTSTPGPNTPTVIAESPTLPPTGPSSLLFNIGIFAFIIATLGVLLLFAL